MDVDRTMPYTMPARIDLPFSKEEKTRCLEPLHLRGSLGPRGEGVTLSTRRYSIRFAAANGFGGISSANDVPADSSQKAAQYSNVLEPERISSRIRPLKR